MSQRSTTVQSNLKNFLLQYNWDVGKDSRTVKKQIDCHFNRRGVALNEFDCVEKSGGGAGDAVLTSRSMANCEAEKGKNRVGREGKVLPPLSVGPIPK